MWAEKVLLLPFAPVVPEDGVIRFWGGDIDDMAVEICAYDLNKSEFYGVAREIDADYDSPEEFRRAYDGWDVFEDKRQCRGA